MAYVANAGSNNIGIVDLTQGKQIDTIPAAGVPLDIMRVGDDWLVTAFRGKVVSRIDSKGLVRKTYDVGKSPSLFSSTYNNNLVSVTSEFADRLSFIDTQTHAIRRVSTGKNPYPAHITSDGVLAFVPNRTDGTVTVYDLLNDKLEATVPVCKNPEGGALTRDEVSYIVACGGDSRVVFINTASFKVVKEISEGIGKRPFSVVAGPDGRYAYVNNAGGSTISVIDLALEKVTQSIKVGEQPIVMRIFNRTLYVTNEVSNTLNVIPLQPEPSTPTPAQKNEVIVLGMIHSGHNTSKVYGLDRLDKAFRQINPDYVLTEMPPNRFDQAQADWKAYGEIREPRIKRFAEYIGMLYPRFNDMNFTIIPTAGWNTQMNDFRRAALGRLAEDPDRAEQWQAYQQSIKIMGEKLQAAGGDDPLFIHTDQYDEIIKEGYGGPYQQYFNDDLGTGGWKTINEAHYANIDKALNQHTGEGKRFVITYGAGHKYWILQELRKRKDITLLDAKPFFQ
jgi:YVTN family beta-propeller protein